MAGKKPATNAGKEAKPKTSSRPAKAKAKAPAKPTVLNGKQLCFVREYLVDLNATQAAIRAGYSSNGAQVQGARLLTNAMVAAEIKKGMAEREKRTDITQDKVLRRWWDIAMADASELTALHYRCCRHCHGINHERQWKDEAEFERAKAEAKANDTSPPNNDGGYGYNPTRDPAPGCPKCFGEGTMHVHLADTRKLSQAGRMLFDGVKETKFGIEIKVQDRGKALENVARHLGMFNDNLTLKGDPENPLVMLMTELAGKTLKPVAE